MRAISREGARIAWLVPFSRRTGAPLRRHLQALSAAQGARAVYVPTPTDKEKRYPLYEKLRATAGNENTAEKVGRSPAWWCPSLLFGDRIRDPVLS